MDTNDERTQRELIEELHEYYGQNVGLVTQGGWIIGGQLGEVFNCVSLMGPATADAGDLFNISSITIFGPVFDIDGEIELDGPFRVWTNLKTLTQILMP